MIWDFPILQLHAQALFEFVQVFLDSVVLSGLHEVLWQVVCHVDCKLMKKLSLLSVLILLSVPALQMVCGFLEKASSKLTSPESSEFAR